MSRGLDYQRLEVPFAKGLNQKVDPRLIQAPEIVRGLDVEGDEVGGLRGRFPFPTTVFQDVFGGGSISNTRRIVRCGDEFLLFTSDTLYSWNAQQEAWVSKGTHLAIKVEEKPVFVTTGDQIEADRAELSGTIVYAWTEASQVYAAAVDKTTGSVLTAPTAIIGAVARPRLVALTTKILLFSNTSSPNLTARAIDPATPATGFASSATNVYTSGAGFDDAYDVEQWPGADAAVFAARGTGGNYEVGVITSALVADQETKARTCDGPIAVAANSDGTILQVIRGDSTNIEGDQISLSDLSDITVNQAIGTGTGTINQITAAFAGSSTTCHVFWTSSQAADATSWDSDYNTVTTAGVIGTAASFIRRLSLASRAFSYNSQVYVWLAFAGESAAAGLSPIEFRAQLQNSYFLYRHDGFLCAKAAWGRAGGFSAANGHLPGAALTSGSTTFTFCGGERRIIPLGEKQSGYSDRGPRDITITFDSNDARRVAKLGESLYVTGGEVLQYDGRQLVECGVHLYPHHYTIVGNLIAGSLADGTYTYRPSLRWDSAKGERDRSTSATAGQVTISAGPNGVEFTSWLPLHVTHKTGLVAEMWRTPVNASADSPFYLATSQDPASTSNPNRYVLNDATAASNVQLNDTMADSTLTTKETHPENYGVLENLAPPAATLIAANDTRLFLAGIPGEPNTIVYSKQRNVGEIAAFNDALTVIIPEPGGDITGLAFLNETLVVFRERAIYALDGFGHDNTGGGTNYQARLVSSDCGAVNQESIVLTPLGLFFKSSKGWYVLNRGWSTQYIGDKVCDYDSDTIYAAHVLESRHQVRIVTSARVLVYDYYADVWFEWSISNALHACIWNGVYHYLITDDVRAEATSYASTCPAWDVEMLVHLGSLQGFARTKKFLVLGEVRGSGTIRVRVGSYAENTYFDDKTWTISPTTAGAELNFSHMPSQQQHKALRIRLTCNSAAGERPKLSALTLEVGFKNATYRHLPSAQKQ